MMSSAMVCDRVTGSVSCGSVWPQSARLDSGFFDNWSPSMTPHSPQKQRFAFSDTDIHRSSFSQQSAHFPSNSNCQGTCAWHLAESALWTQRRSRSDECIQTDKPKVMVTTTDQQTQTDKQCIEHTTQTDEATETDNTTECEHASASTSSASAAAAPFVVSQPDLAVMTLHETQELVITAHVGRMRVIGDMFDAGARPQPQMGGLLMLNLRAGARFGVFGVVNVPQILMNVLELFQF